MNSIFTLEGSKLTSLVLKLIINFLPVTHVPIASVDSICALIFKPVKLLSPLKPSTFIDVEPVSLIVIFTPLLQAAQQGHLDVVEFFLVRDINNIISVVKWKKENDSINIDMYSTCLIIKK